MSDKYYKNDLLKILYTEQQINEGVEKLARQIEEYYKDKSGTLLAVGILKGSVVFMGELLKRLNIPCEIDFMKCSSYGSGTTSSGVIAIKCDLSKSDISDCNILVIEDILDTGNTLKKILQHLTERGAKSVKLCTLLDKPDRRKVDIEADFVAFKIPDEFVVGYGLDFDEKYRNMPEIGVLKPEIYQK